MAYIIPLLLCLRKCILDLTIFSYSFKSPYFRDGIIGRTALMMLICTVLSRIIVYGKLEAPRNMDSYLTC